MASNAAQTANRFVQNVDDFSAYGGTSNDSTPYLTDHSEPLSKNVPPSPTMHQQHYANEPLCTHVERVVRQYFAMLGDEIPTDLYELILKEIERPLLSVVLEQTRGNQTKCAQILGLNRGTLRKKLKTYDLM